jgi:hypothetical protein
MTKDGRKSKRKAAYFTGSRQRFSQGDDLNLFTFATFKHPPSTHGDIVHFLSSKRRSHLFEAVFITAFIVITAFSSPPSLRSPPFVR